MFPYLAAALCAAGLALFEQAGQLNPGRKAPRSLHAVWCWSQRLAGEAFFAVIALGIVDLGGLSLGGTEVADHVGGGVVVALATTLGLRSNLVELPEQALGIHDRFSAWRGRITDQLRTLQAVEASSTMVDEVLPAVRASKLTLDDVAQRLEYFVRDLPLSPEEKAAEIAFVRETLSDDATKQVTRMDTLMAKAHELGGDPLVKTIKDVAERDVEE